MPDMMRACERGAMPRSCRSQRKACRSSAVAVAYDIIRAFLGSFRAGFWQGFGKLFGVSLKAGYDPAGDREDAILERVACGVEEGTIG